MLLYVDNKKVTYRLYIFNAFIINIHFKSFAISLLDVNKKQKYIAYVYRKLTFAAIIMNNV
jgi:hypothetical protein